MIEKQWLVYGLVVSIAIIILINILGKTNFPKELIISQATLDKVDDTLLLERNPIVISDSIVNCDEMIKNVFSYMYVANRPVQVNGENENTLEKNKFQYLVFWSQEGDADVIIQHPTKGYVMIKLHVGNILILPWAWKYQIKKRGELKLYGLHSIMTLTLTLGLF